MFELFKTALQHSEKLTIIVNADADNSSLVVAIIADPKKDGVKVKPITIRGTYEEVDAQLTDALEMVFDKNSGAFTNAALVAKQAAKAAEEKTKAVTAKPGAKAKAKTRTEEKDKEEEVDLDEKEELDEQEETSSEEIKEEVKETAPAVSQPDLFASSAAPATKPKKPAAAPKETPAPAPVIEEAPAPAPTAPPAAEPKPADDDMDIF